MTSLENMGHRGIDAVRSLARAGFDFVFPPTCPCCGRESVAFAKAGSPRHGLCRRCGTELLIPVSHPCRRCGAPAGPYLRTTEGCAHCRGERYVFETVFCLGIYEGALRRACLMAKEPGGGPLAAALAELLLELHGPALRNAQLDVVVPVPHHWTQRWRRPQHAATTIAHALARSLRIEFGGSILSKVRRTPSQASLPASRRRTNLRGALEARNGMDLSGAVVLLVDDVLTTGATSQAASKVLLRAGAQRVLVAVAARALGNPSAARTTSGTSSQRQ